MALSGSWEEAIPDAVWPTAMLAAIRRDVSALGAPRVIATLRLWQRELSSDRPAQRADAARWLGLVAEAIRSPIATPMDGDEETVAAGQGRTRADEDTSPTAVAYRAELQAERAAGEAREDGRVRLRRPGSRESRALDPTPPPALVIRKPRAAPAQVLSLYGAIAPFCRELLPLSPVRRSRRFWSLWREVSGDRHVQREPVEELLARKDLDFRGLVGGLIAEVQGVDPESVRAVLEKVEDTGTRPTLERKNRERPERVVRGPSVRVTGIDPSED